MVHAIIASSIFHAFGCWNKGVSIFAPYPKLKKKNQEAQTAPKANHHFPKAYWVEIDPINMTVSK